MGGCSGYCGGERWSHLPGRGLRACIHNRWAGLFPAIRHPSMMNTGSKFFSLAIRCPGAHERRKKFFWKLVKKGFTNEKIWCIVILASGLVAQLGERSVRIREVDGSIPFRSTTKAVKSMISRLFSCLFFFLCDLIFAKWQNTMVIQSYWRKRQLVNRHDKTILHGCDRRESVIE